jgi:hypothetical protein
MPFFEAVAHGVRNIDVSSSQAKKRSIINKLKKTKNVRENMLKTLKKKIHENNLINKKIKKQMNKILIKF